MAVIRYDSSKLVAKFVTAGSARDAHAKLGGCLDANRVTFHRRGSCSQWGAFCYRMVADLAEFH
jgi:hypothetical protein